MARDHGIAVSAAPDQERPRVTSDHDYVYTCLFGEYEDLQEQPVRAESSATFVCFTDRSDLTSETWTIRRVEPAVPGDAPRSSRHPKILPHLHLADADRSLYIDNSVRLQRAPEEILVEMLPETSDDACFIRHSFRDSLWDEFGVVQQLGFDTPERISETLDAAMRLTPTVLDQSPLWGGMIARRHHREPLIRTMEQWWTMVLRYSRRDQLSLPIVVAGSSASVRVIDWDNHQTSSHQWPIDARRNRASYAKPALQAGRSKLLSLLEENARLRGHTEGLESMVASMTRELEATRTQLADAQTRADALEVSLDQTLGSASWRATGPLRRISAFLRTR
jgi:hypothetical protein